MNSKTESNFMIWDMIKEFCAIVDIYIYISFWNMFDQIQSSQVIEIIDIKVTGKDIFFMVYLPSQNQNKIHKYKKHL